MKQETKNEKNARLETTPTKQASRGPHAAPPKARFARVTSDE
jgi:hypothetical protein